VALHRVEFPEDVPPMVLRWGSKPVNAASPEREPSRILCVSYVSLYRA
jgi:hypothetical protein